MVEKDEKESTGKRKVKHLPKKQEQRVAKGIKNGLIKRVKNSSRLAQEMLGSKQMCRVPGGRAHVTLIFWI